MTAPQRESDPAGTRTQDLRIKRSVPDTPECAAVEGNDRDAGATSTAVNGNARGASDAGASETRHAEGVPPRGIPTEQGTACGKCATPGCPQCFPHPAAPAAGSAAEGGATAGLRPVDVDHALSRLHKRGCACCDRVIPVLYNALLSERAALRAAAAPEAPEALVSDDLLKRLRFASLGTSPGLWVDRKTAGNLHDHITALRAAALSAPRAPEAPEAEVLVDALVGAALVAGGWDGEAVPGTRSARRRLDAARSALLATLRAQAERVAALESRVRELEQEREELSDVRRGLQARPHETALDALDRVLTDRSVELGRLAEKHDDLADALLAARAAAERSEGDAEQERDDADPTGPCASCGALPGTQHSAECFYMRVQVGAVNDIGQARALYDRLRKAVAYGAEVFECYASINEAKRTPAGMSNAEADRRHARTLRAALSAARAATEDPASPVGGADAE